MASKSQENAVAVIDESPMRDDSTPSRMPVVDLSSSVWDRNGINDLVEEEHYAAPLECGKGIIRVGMRNGCVSHRTPDRTYTVAGLIFKP